MSQAGGQKPAANRMTLQTFKARLGGASKGFKLLKKKRDALKAKFQALLKEIVDTKLKVGEGLKDGAFSLAKAHYASSGDDIASTVIERAKRPSITTKLYPDNVAGVSIPLFKMSYDASKDSSAQTLGVACGGAVINAARETYRKAVVSLEMDEQAREEFFRVKKVVEKKKVKLQKEKDEMAAAGKRTEAAIDAPSMLATKKDEDLIF
eukprot:g28850.t1